MRPAGQNARGRGAEPAAAHLERARELCRRVLLVDTHIDLPWRLSKKWEDVSRPTTRGEFDWPRARAGGLGVAFLAIYIPASYQDAGGARAKADELLDGVDALLAEHPDRFARVTSPAEALGILGGERVGLALGIENGAAIEGDLANLAHFHERGVRYVTLTHGRANALCDSSFDERRPWRGLSPFGRDVVREMNRLGLLVDVSHITDEALRDVLATSRAPVIASHSSSRLFTPGWERNLADEGVRDLAAGGGVVHVNFGSAFLVDRYRLAHEAARQRMRARLAERGLDEDSIEAEALREAWLAEPPIERATVADAADHIDHLVDLAGIAHVGLGSDFEGLGDTLPDGLRDVADYPNLIAELLSRGYAESDLENIASANLLRAWSDAQAHAAAAQGAG